MSRIFGPRADESIIRFKGFDLLNGNIVTSMYFNRKIIVHEHLHQIICKGIVIINYKKFRQISDL